MIFYVAESCPLTRFGNVIRYWERSVTDRWYETGMLHADLDK
ncbi:hypothetical protein [Sinorhizobium meliloti]|nr:hypothetical protein [Sinorhizobium meliloti]